MGTLLVIFGLGFCIFCVYIAIKQIEFILKAIPLYEKIVLTQEKTVSVLKEINEKLSSQALGIQAEADGSPGLLPER